MFHALSMALGGLGIFFYGMYQLKENLKKLTGRRFKQLVARWVRHPVAAVALGVAAGGIMQSTTVVAFILASMISGGLLTIGSALPIVTGANVGSTLLVMIASLDIQLFVFVLLGLTGTSFIFERMARFRSLASAIFSVGLVFFGLKILQTGIAPLTEQAWVGHLLSMAGASYFLPLLIAVGLTVLSQSSSSVVLLTITLAAAGGLTFEQAMMAIYGCNLGSSCQTFLLSSNLRGRPKQLAMYQASFNICTACLMLPLFFIEQYAAVGLVEKLAKSLADSQSVQLAFVQVIFNFLGAVLMLILMPWLRRLMARLFPELPDEDDGQLIFIHDQAAQDPESALDLVRLEQHRLASYLIKRIDVARAAPPDSLSLIERQNRNFTALSGEIQEFLRHLANAPFDLDGYDRLNQTISRQRILDNLNETLFDLVKMALQVGNDRHARTLLGNIIEGLDAVVLTMLDAVGDGTSEDRALFHSITRDRGGVMQRIRQSYLAVDTEMPASQKASILILTNLAERAFWLLGQLADQEQVQES